MPADRRSVLRLLAGSGLGLATATGARAAEEIHHRAIPRSGERIPAIGLGTWQTFDVADEAAALDPLREVLAAFVEDGGRVIDSSPMYGRSEEVTGRLAAELELREKLFVATKVWIRGRAEGVAQMEDSMRKLGVEVVDLMQIHNLLDTATHLDTLRAWKREGRIRHLGLTHYHAGRHDEVARWIESEEVDFLQINLSLAEREAERRLLPLARERGVAVIVNRPFAGGEVFARLRERPLPDWAAEIDCESWAQLMLKYVISHPAVTCAIPATSRVRHLRDNMGALRGALPDPAMRERIAAATAA